MKKQFGIFSLGMILATGTTHLASAQPWTLTSAPYEPWSTIACSADGSKLIASGYSIPVMSPFYPTPIYMSADTGVTWTQTTAPTGLWSSVASSADGTKYVAAAHNRPPFGLGDPSVVGLIYTSQDSGSTWK